MRQSEELSLTRRPRMAMAALCVAVLVAAGLGISANLNAVVRASTGGEEIMATSMATNAENGIVRLQGHHSVDGP